MAENGHFLRAENRMDDVMIHAFPSNFKSYVKNKQLLCQRVNLCSGWVFWSGEDDRRERPPPPPHPISEIIDGALIAPPIPEFMKIKSHFKQVVGFSLGAQFLIQFWKVVEIGGKRLLTTRHQLFGFNHINEGLCRYRLISLDYEFGVDGVSNEHLGLHGRVFRHQQLEFTPNVQCYSCKEYPQRDHAISCNIKHSLAVPLFEPSTRCCIGVIEMVSTSELIKIDFDIFNYNYMLSKLVRGLPSSNCEHSYDRKDKDETLEELRKMEDVQKCIINLSQRLQRKAGIPISLEDLQQRFGMKLKDAAESLGVSRSTVKRACREYNITWWSPRKRSKDNQSLSNKLVQGVVQEQILESSQPPISDPPHMQDMAIASRTKPHFIAAQDTSIVTIKAKYGDDFIKFQLPMSSGMLEFQQQVAKRLNLQGGTYRVKYQDEDNDWILIVCDDDLQNCICNSISQGRNTVTMLIQPITNCPS